MKHLKILDLMQAHVIKSRLTHARIPVSSQCQMFTIAKTMSILNKRAHQEHKNICSLIEEKNNIRKHICKVNHIRDITHTQRSQSNVIHVCIVKLQV